MRENARALYSCYTKAPVRHSGLVAAYGAKSVYRDGKCKKGEWGYNHRKLKWSKFTK